MITDKERRAVAGKLRGFEEDGSSAKAIYGGTEGYDRMLVRALRLIIGKGDLFGKLADLIDRSTCSNLMKPRGMAPVETDDWFECSECHCKARQNAIGMVVCYCLNCGAEVIE